MKEKKHIAIFRMILTNATPERYVKWLANVHLRAFQTQAYLRKYNRHNWDVQVRGYLMPFNGWIDHPSYAREAINEWWLENGDDFDPNYWVAWGNTYRKNCGLAVIGGNRAMVNGMHGDNVCGIGTIGHELLHNMGLHHSGMVWLDGASSEYKDDTCIMGGGGNKLKGLCSPQMVRLNMDTPKERLVVETTQQVLICPIELPWHSQHENEFQHIILRKAGFDDIYLSLRKTKGWVYMPPANTARRLYAHIFQRNGMNKRIAPDMFPHYDPWVLPNGMTVIYHEYADETARVSILVNPDDPVPDDLEMPVGFPASIPSAVVTPEHNGSWYNADFDGQGFDIHIHGDQMVLYWYTAGGRFYYASAPAGTEAFTLYTTTGGTWDNPSKYTPVIAGTGKLEFFDLGRGVFHYHTEEHGRGAIEITPVRLTTQPMNGVYYQPDKDGSGFTFQFFDNEQVSAFWYTYDNDGNQKWYTCQGLLDGNVAELDIYEVLGLEWMYFSKIEVRKVGTADAAIDDSIRFDYTINGQSGTLNLERLF